MNARPKIVAETSIQIPSNEAAERAVLGALLIDGRAITQIMDRLRPESFYNVAHTLIYEAMLTRAGDAAGPDLVTTCAALEAKGVMAAVGGLSYVAALAEGLPDVANIAYYAELVTECFAKRKLLTLAQRAIGLASSPSVTSTSALEIVATGVFEIADGSGAQQPAELGALGAQVYDDVIETHLHPELMRGIPSCFEHLDLIFNGFERARVYVLSALTGVGKSALAFNISTRIARRFGKRVLYFVLEMHGKQLAMREMAGQCGIPAKRLRRGILMQDDRKRLERAVDAMQVPVTVDWRTPLGLTGLQARIRRAQIRGPVDLVVIDHLALMQLPREKGDSNEVALSNLSHGIQQTAMSMNIPILLLHQMSRDFIRRGKELNIPRNDDLKGSGSIEQDADTIWFLVRKTQIEDDTPAGHGAVRHARLAITKQRDGETGVVDLLFDPATAHFTEAL